MHDQFVVQIRKEDLTQQKAIMRSYNKLNRMNSLLDSGPPLHPIYQFVLKLSQYSCYNNHILFKLAMSEEEAQEISIEDLQLSLQVYEIEGEEKVNKLKALFAEKGAVDLSKMFYEEKSSLEIKFQNIISDLTEFLINQQIASTDKLRRTFYRILENPLNFLFKVSRFEIFNLRLNAFDIELEPIDAVCELGTSILANIEKYQQIAEKLTTRVTGGQYKSFEEFQEDAQRRLIQDLIFTFYSYLRKGGAIIRKKFEDKVRVVELYNQIQSKIIRRCVEMEDVKTLKELSILNYELFLLENSYDVLCFYLKLPFKAVFAEAFRQLETLGLKAKQNSNYNLFILIYLRYSKEILAKLDHEGIDAEFAPYIENTLTSLLELWGCRLCYYHQFYQLFCKLLSLHPNKSSVLQTILKFNPDLKKDDIVLLRTNFKHELQQKQSELLSLLKPKSMEEINNSLSALYHQTLYSLDFASFSRQEILELINLLNGNASLGEFFGITERAFKEWNHSIDFTNPLKFIEGQFKYPALEEAKVLESIRLVNNLCVFEAKSPKEYEQLIKAGSIQRILISFASFLLHNEKGAELVANKELIKSFLVNNLVFLKHSIINPSDWEPLCLLYSKGMAHLTETFNAQIINILKQIIDENFTAFSIRNVLTIFKDIVGLEGRLQLASASETLEYAVDTFLKSTLKQNQEIQNFRFFDSNISDIPKVSRAEEAFLKEYACLNGQVIEAKNCGCFVLSELEIITNPVQFDKVMDNYYFSLDKNSKKFIQSLTVDWTESSHETVNSTITIIQKLIERYPISIPLLCTTRVTLKEASARFIELLVREVNPQSFALVQSIVSCRCIRYRNGKDYIKEEIIPIVLKETLKQINGGSDRIEHFELLALSVTGLGPSEVKLDLIQSSIELIKHEIAQAKDEQRVYRLTNAHCQVLSKFFQKKEADMRKKGLKAIFLEQIWNENRIQLTNLQNQGAPKATNRVKVPDHIMVTPHTSPQDFDSEAVKLEKVVTPQVKAAEKPQIDSNTLRGSLTAKPAIVSLVIDKKSQSFTTVDLSGLKYNIESHLGEQVKHFCRKEGFRIITNSPDSTARTEGGQQNITFVQYYLKEYQVPQINAALVNSYLKALLKGQVQYSTLFSNVNNVQKLFASLIILLGFYAKGIPSPKSRESTVDQLLSFEPQAKDATLKSILRVLSAIGYTNLWAQNYNSLGKLNYLQEFRKKAQFKQESEEETFFSWVLRLCLENEALKEDFNSLLGQIFRTRPRQQNALMYKVTLDRAALNLIMKSLQIQNLSHVSLLFHSNYNNLRLYTDQLHEGLKALGMSSKNRAYNEYIQLSKDLEDEQFYTPMKLFKENFSFFIRIEKEGYKFKREEEQKIGRERVLKVLRSGVSGDQLKGEIEKVIEQFEVQLNKLQHNIASRVKAFYLATKLRDLSFQNAKTICLLHEILSQAKESNQNIMAKIDCVEIFSLMIRLYNELVRFGRSAQCSNFLQLDSSITEKDVNICSTRRYSHSMSKVYEKCDLELDEVIQRCIDSLKYFFTTDLGSEWLTSLDVCPPFLAKSFVGTQIPQKTITNIRQTISNNCGQHEPLQISSNEASPYSAILKSIRQLKKGHILGKNLVRVKLQGKVYTLSELLVVLRDQMLASETFQKSKDGFLLFNKYKTSEKTLEEIELLGITVGYCIYHGIEMDLHLHSSLLAAIGFSVCDLQDLLDVDFKVWEDLRNVMSAAESKQLGLNFSYVFESLQTLKAERVELLDKGTSKKVNNLNREQYCDLVCCYLLYQAVLPQLTRLLNAICYVCPIELLSCLQVSQLHRLFIKKYPKYSESILKQHMRKRGLVLPDTVLSRGKRIQNLKDYQSIQWLCEVVEEVASIKEKIWKNERNIFVCTWMGQGVEFQHETGLLLMGRVKSKDDLKQALSSLK